MIAVPAPQKLLVSWPGGASIRYKFDKARRISDRIREVLAAARELVDRLGGYREPAAWESAARRERATTEAEPLRGVLASMLAAGMSYGEAVQALAGVGKVSSARKPFPLAQVGKTLPAC